VIDFFAEPSPKLDLTDYQIGDSDLQAILDALQTPQFGVPRDSERPPLTEIYLGGNRRLTDLMVSMFLSTVLQGSLLRGPLRVAPIKAISLAHCIGIGESTFDVLCKLMHEGVHLRHLEVLDLLGVQVPTVIWPRLCESIGHSPLRRLGLGQTGCGRYFQESCCAVAALIGGGSCNNLEHLDVSGNHFLHEGCMALGDSLTNADDKFHDLDISHNAGFSSDPNRDEKEDATNAEEHTLINPIMHVLEVLGETTVTHVAFANCQLAYEEDCILEDAVASSDITHL
jgi:hypothetical protein